jgi:CRISPR system Cascade subunit CasE
MGETGAVLVQAAVPGHWDALDNLQGYVAKLDADKPLDLERRVVAGRRYRFRLAANPTVTRNGRRLGLLREDEQLAWLNRQAQRGGFEIAGAMCSTCDRIEVPHGRGGSRITVARVRFDGELVATEPVAFRRSMQAGIGHAKALGLGLLSIASV